MIGKPKAFLDQVFADEPRRDLASIEVMKRSFPNYYKKYNNDPAEMSPQEHYKSQLPQYIESNGLVSPTEELAMDLFGDPSLSPEIIDSQIREKSGFKENEIPILPLHPSRSGVGYFQTYPNNHIEINKHANNRERAATLMHEFEHARDFKNGFKAKHEKHTNGGAELEQFLKSIKNNPEKVLREFNEGHHQRFIKYDLDYPQYEIAKENIYQGDPVHKEILTRYPDLKNLQDEYQKNPNAFADKKRIYVDNTPAAQEPPKEETYEESARRRLKALEQAYADSEAPFNDIKRLYFDKNSTQDDQIYEPQYTQNNQEQSIMDQILSKLKSLGTK